MTIESKATSVAAETLISNYPLFCLLSAEDIKKLVLLTKEIQVDAGDRIVIEGDLVDYFYLIQSGTAEVTKDIVTVEKTQTVHIANLGEGDAIGLSESGFFSQTGIRKASVTAQTPMNLIAFDIHGFDKFLNSPSVLYPALKDIGEKFLLMHFLKNSRFFKNITNTQTRQLAHNANRVLIKAGDLIFNEGDSADTGYFLLSGTVEIFAHYQGQKIIIKELEAPNFFGESAFLDKGKRNAGALAKTACNVILIGLQEIEKVLNGDEAFLDSLALSRMEQIRPKPCDGIVEHPHAHDETESRVLLSNSNGNKVLLSPQEYEVWKRIDGSTPILDIQSECTFLSTENIYSFVMKMNKAEFLEVDEHVITHSVSGAKQLVNNFIYGIKKIWK